MRSLLLLLCLCCSAVYADGVFAKASFPDSLLKEVPRAKMMDPAWLNEVELHELPASELHKLIKQFPAHKTRPEMIHYKPPMYPLNLREINASGSVIVYCVVLKDGTAGDIYVGDYTYPDFAKAAALALKFWRFKPMTEDNLFGVQIPFTIK